jgi:1,4-alpha-glucan branching enzyme
VCNKGFEDLIKAAAFFKDKDVSFVIVGPTPDLKYLQTLHSLINHFGLSSKILMTGWLPDKEVVNLYFLSDIFVFPSILDTFGLVNLDAMAAGKPIIATSTGGVPEIVRNGENGIIIKPGDYLELAKAIDKLVNDNSLCESMGKTGKKLAFTNYSWEKIAAMTLTEYRSLC